MTAVSCRTIQIDYDARIPAYRVQGEQRTLYSGTMAGAVYAAFLIDKRNGCDSEGVQKKFADMLRRSARINQ